MDNNNSLGRRFLYCSALSAHENFLSTHARNYVPSGQSFLPFASEYALAVSLSANAPRFPQPLSGSFLCAVSSSSSQASGGPDLVWNLGPGPWPCFFSASICDCVIISFSAINGSFVRSFFSSALRDTYVSLLSPELEVGNWG